MTVREIQQKMEELGWSEESVKDHHLYLQIVGLASHFYSLGFSQSVTEFIDAEEDYISTMMA